MKFSERIATCQRCPKCTDRLCRRPLGNLNSQIAFLIPPPSVAECQQKKLLDSEFGINFIKKLQKVNFDIAMDALIVPITFCNTRMQKHTVENCRSHVARWLKDKAIVCICGNDVYKAYFGIGKMPELLLGNSFIENNVTYFCFSDIRKLLDCFDDYSIEAFWHNKFNDEIILFAKFLEKKLCKS